ncbi:MAG: putative Zn-dependent peptidase [Myxococcales bacterium]|nr:putative Zn-dependent peptidase [Myxococcales bacterium]
MRPLTLLALVFTPTLVTAAPPPVQQKTMPNGLQVLVAEDHSVPLITVEIAAKNGSMTESPEYNGLSHLYEHMFFKANAGIPTQEAYMTRARQLGMVWNGTTNTERVNYFFTTTSDHFADAMVFMRDAIVSPLFDAKELERERVVVTGELDRNESMPGYHLWHEASKRIWWKYPSYKDPLGNRQTVLTATREKMLTIKDRYYVPNNSVLVVTGDVRAADVFAQAETLYAKWKRGEDPFKKHPLVKHPPIKKTEVVFVEQPVENVQGTLDWHGPSTVGPSVPLTYAADVLGTALNEPASKFQQALVDSGACVRAYFNWLTAVNTGPITISFEARPDKVDACIRAAQSEVKNMRSPDYLGDEETANSIHRLEVDVAREREKPSDYAHTITFWWTSAGLDYYRGYIDHVRKVKRADMARFVDGFLTNKPYVLSVMVSPESGKELHLDQAHFETLAGVRK